jgi:hypothetical protein
MAEAAVRCSAAGWETLSFHRIIAGVDYSHIQNKSRRVLSPRRAWCRTGVEVRGDVITA